MSSNLSVYIIVFDLVVTEYPGPILDVFLNISDKLLVNTELGPVPSIYSSQSMNIKSKSVSLRSHSKDIYYLEI